MSDNKTTLLVLGAGCAAMVGIAAAVVSTGSFFSDVPSSRAMAAAFQLPPKKVKTVAIVDKPAEKGAAVAEADRSPTSSVKVAVGERSALHGASPRWARNSSTSAPSSSDKQALLAAYADDEANTGNLANQMDGTNDPFAMMGSTEDSAPTVDLAATVPHVPLPAPRDEAAREPADDNSPAPAPKAATTNRALTGTTTLNEAANMRSAARSGSAVIMVVPDGSRVSIAPGCEQWCEISYNGRRGYVYKDFIGGNRTAAVKPRAKTENASAESLDKSLYSDSNFINSGGQSTRSSGTDEKTADDATATAKKPTPEPSMR